MRVLLADNRVWLRSALRLLLEHEANVEVVGEVANTEALPRSISQLRPDLLFLDWQLPGIEANSARQFLLDKVRAIQPHLYIIALTNDLINEANGNYRQSMLGADAYVSKAEPPERLLTVLRQVATGYASGIV
jgi:DNA-binding NarL/FixJ family response regulator